MELKKQTIFEELADLECEKKKCEQELDDLNAKCEEKSNLVIELSTFDAKAIGDAIAKLITRIDGRKFECRETQYCSVNGNFASYIREASSWENIDFTKGGEAVRCISIKDAMHLTHDINRNDEESQKRTFYYENHNCCYYYKKLEPVHHSFAYVKDFIDALIQYRYVNNLKEITAKNIDDFTERYITSYIQHEPVKETTSQTLLEEVESLYPLISAKGRRLNDLYYMCKEKENKIVGLSKFDALLITKSIAELITRITGREFESCSMWHGSPKGNIWEFMVYEKDLTVHHYLDKDTIPAYTKQGQAIYLGTTWYSYYYDPEISFYEEKKFGFNVDLYDQFDYVKGFIDMLIQYSLENKSKEIKQADIDLCMGEFINGYEQPTTQDPTKTKEMQVSKGE